MYRKITATPAGCVRFSQAGTKLDRTQTTVGLLRFGIQVNKCILELTQYKYITLHDIYIGARGVSGTAVTAGC